MEEVSPVCVKRFTVCAIGSELGSASSAMTGRSMALPPMDSLPTMARKARELAHHSIRSTRVHSAAATPASSATAVSKAASTPSGVGLIARATSRVASPEAAPSKSSGCSSSGEWPAPPHTPPLTRRKGKLAQAEVEGTAEVKAADWLTSQCSAERASIL